MKSDNVILNTRDFSMFNFPDFKISKNHLNKMKESISEKDLSKDYPILVDRKFNIIEGRYRFLALYELQKEVYYKVAEVTSIKDAIRIKHIHKNIAIEDVVNAYSDLEPYNNILLLHSEINEEFSIRFIMESIGFCQDKSSIDYPNAKNSIIQQSSPNLKRVGINRKMIDSGNLTNWDYNKVLNFINKAKKFKEKYGEFGFDEYSYYWVISCKDYYNGYPYLFDFALRNASKYISLFYKKFPDRIHGISMSLIESVRQIISFYTRGNDLGDVLPHQSINYKKFLTERSNKIKTVKSDK